MTPREKTMSPIQFRDISKSRIAGLVFLLFVWVVFALWQWSEHVHQCRLIHQTLSSQGDALSSAVRSGIQSHRWFGPFVQEQLPSALETLARSTNVISIAVVVGGDSEHPYCAGDRRQVALELPSGEHLLGDTLQVVRTFTMKNDPPLGGMFSGAQGIAETESFRSIVVLDRSETISQIHVEARNRVLIFALGTMLLVSVGAVWQFTVRLAQAEGKARLLAAQTQHLSELGQAAAGLAHETRNPLGLIRGWTQRLVDAGLPKEDQQDQAEAVLEECDRVTARINQFLAFARQADVELGPVVICDVVEGLKMLLQSDLDEKDLHFETVGLDHPKEILADRDQLQQILFNLLQNAIAFAPDHSTVTLLMKKSQLGTYRIEVCDQGPGAAEEIADRLFEPYVTRRIGGTGLGLSIVRRTAAAHGWDVGYNPAEDGGSLFWIDGIRSV